MRSMSHQMRPARGSGGLTFSVSDSNGSTWIRLGGSIVLGIGFLRAPANNLTRFAGLCYYCRPTELACVEEASTRGLQFQRVAGWCEAIRVRAETPLRAGKLNNRVGFSGLR